MIYQVFNHTADKKPSFITTEYQKAIDSWSYAKSLGDHPFIYVSGSFNGKEVDQTLNSESSIYEFSRWLLINEQEPKMNRVERRILKEMQEQEENGMTVVEPFDDYGFYKEVRFTDEIPELMGKVFKGNPEVKVDIDFHGKFEEMSEEEQDQIINPKHYKMIPPEAYERFPEGLEYMDLMEYILAPHGNVQAHILGQVFKYSCRLGKKDSKLQDAIKIAWYANRLVKVIENEG